MAKKKEPPHLYFCDTNLTIGTQDPYVKDVLIQGGKGPYGWMGNPYKSASTITSVEPPNKKFVQTSGRSINVRDYSRCKFVADKGWVDMGYPFDSFDNVDGLRYLANGLQRAYVTGADLNKIPVRFTFEGLAGKEDIDFKLDDRAIIANRFTEVSLLPMTYQTKLAILQCAPPMEYIPDVGLKVTNSYFFVLCNDTRIKWSTLQNCYKRGPITPINKLDNKIVLPKPNET